jgi:hypothetical protein
MPERRRRPDLDEPFSLHPLEGEEVLRKLLEDEDETATEDEDS